MTHPPPVRWLLSLVISGIKRNLQRTYASWSQTKLNSTDQGRALFTLAWFHALIQERRTYIPQGWAKFYEFNDSDLNAALNILNARLSQGEILEKKRICWSKELRRKFVRL